VTAASARYAARRGFDIRQRVRDIARLREVPGIPSYETGGAGRADGGVGGSLRPQRAKRLAPRPRQPASWGRPRSFPRLAAGDFRTAPRHIRLRPSSSTSTAAPESFLAIDFQDLASATYVSDEVHHGENRKIVGHFTGDHQCGHLSPPGRDAGFRDVHARAPGRHHAAGRSASRLWRAGLSRIRGRFHLREAGSVGRAGTGGPLGGSQKNWPRVCPAPARHRQS